MILVEGNICYVLDLKIKVFFFCIVGFVLIWSILVWLDKVVSFIVRKILIGEIVFSKVYLYDNVYEKEGICI